MLITTEQYNNHFNALRKSNIELDRLTPLKPICPICLQPFSDIDSSRKATKEHAPLRCLGGFVVALTCKDCNSSTGGDVDIHLVNFLKSVDQRNFETGSTRSVIIHDDSDIVRGEMSIDDCKTMTIKISEKCNDTRRLSSILSKWIPNRPLNFENKKLKLDKINLNSAILKTAYILLYAVLGYNVLLWKEYDRIREQILNPDSYIIPPLWTLQDLGVKDGIYYNNDCGLRGFFVVFSVVNPDTKNKFHFTVLLPAPQTDFGGANILLRQIKSGDRLSIGCISGIDFLNSAENITQLNRWAYGNSLTLYNHL